MALDPRDLVLRRIEEVDKDILANFDCGRAELNEFLKDDALDYSDHGITETVVVFLAGNIAGYFSLSSDAVKLTPDERYNLWLPFNTSVKAFPAVKLTKLAVCCDYQSRGVGRRLIELICGLASNVPFAVRLITVDAINQPEVISFYEREGFRDCLSAKNGPIKLEDRNHVLMYKDIHES